MKPFGILLVKPYLSVSSPGSNKLALLCACMLFALDKLPYPNINGNYWLLRDEVYSGDLDSPKLFLLLSKFVFIYGSNPGSCS
jgi:hypothetical protein